MFYTIQVRPLVLIGQTGVGKSFIAQAIALQVCHHGKSALDMNVTTWLENVSLARSSGTYLRYRDRLAQPDLAASKPENLQGNRKTVKHRRLRLRRLPIHGWAQSAKSAGLNR